MGDTPQGVSAIAVNEYQLFTFIQIETVSETDRGIACVVSFLSLEACLVCRTDSLAAPSWWPSTPQQHVRGAGISVGLGVLFFTSAPSTGETLLFDNSEVHRCGCDRVVRLSLNPECTICEEEGKQGPVCLLIPPELPLPCPCAR